ncbi:hypothetical protein BX285_3976 [Streptomyces sp. 1114.5]|nr:hypothetical protein BX285_3976 [Streptomyces sp. 1114.5]SOB85712.1 hypothetical protein SAMN06272789_6005 [Streptomyces sp. 1331.2]
MSSPCGSDVPRAPSLTLCRHARPGSDSWSQDHPIGRRGSSWDSVRGGAWSTGGAVVRTGTGSSWVRGVCDRWRRRVTGRGRNSAPSVQSVLRIKYPVPVSPGRSWLPRLRSSSCAMSWIRGRRDSRTAGIGRADCVALALAAPVVAVVVEQVGDRQQGVAGDDAAFPGVQAERGASLALDPGIGVRRVDLHVGEDAGRDSAAAAVPSGASNGWSSRSSVEQRLERINAEPLAGLGQCGTGRRGVSIAAARAVQTCQEAAHDRAISRRARAAIPTEQAHRQDERHRNPGRRPGPDLPGRHRRRPPPPRPGLCPGRSGGSECAARARSGAGSVSLAPVHSPVRHHPVRSRSSSAGPARSAGTVRPTGPAPRCRRR